MISGIRWIRIRQRTLARVALALFALAWLQAAVVPCSMAFAVDPATAAATHSHDASHAGHASGNDGHAGHDPVASPSAHCPYCPPAMGGEGADCEHDSECAFPHDPQIDARTLTALFGPPPSHFLGLGSKLDTPALSVLAGDVERDVPRRPLAISYCRFIE
jgi:hypothetical protein